MYIYVTLLKIIIRSLCGGGVVVKWWGQAAPVPHASVTTWQTLPSSWTCLVQRYFTPLKIIIKSLCGGGVVVKWWGQAAPVPHASVTTWQTLLFSWTCLVQRYVTPLIIYIKLWLLVWWLWSGGDQRHQHHIMAVKPPDQFCLRPYYFIATFL